MKEKIKIRKLKKLLNEDTRVLVFSSVDSTNSLAKSLVLSGEKMPFLVVTNKQTAGRGRQGKSFYSAKNGGIYMTLAVGGEFVSSSAVTAAAATATAKSINELTENSAKIKWVNDVYIEGKKASGILCEAVKEPMTDKVIGYLIGIGINTDIEKFPDELVGIATSVKLKRGKKNVLAADIINRLMYLLKDVDNSFLEEYKRLSLALGKEIVFIEKGQESLAVAVDIDTNGGLIVKLESGEIKTLTGGEISLKIRPSV